MQVLFASEYCLTSALGLYLSWKVWDGAAIGLKVKFHLQKTRGLYFGQTKLTDCHNYAFPRHTLLDL